MQTLNDLSPTQAPVDSHDKEAWRGLSQQWEQSGESRKVFCERRGLNPHTLSYWRSQFIKEKKAAIKAKAFVPVQVQSIAEPVIPSDSLLSIKTPKGHVVSIPITVDAPLLAKVFQVLGLTHA